MPGPFSDSERRTSHHLHTKHITNSLETSSNDIWRYDDVTSFYDGSPLQDLPASFPTTSQNRSVRVTPQSYLWTVCVGNVCALCSSGCWWTSDGWFATAPAHSSASVLFSIWTLQSVCCQGLNSLHLLREQQQRGHPTHLVTLHCFIIATNILCRPFPGRKPTNLARKFLYMIFVEYVVLH